MSQFNYYVDITGGALLQHPLEPPFYGGPYKSQEAALHNAVCEMERSADLGVFAKIEVTRVNQSPGKHGGSTKRLYLLSCHPETVPGIR